MSATTLLGSRRFGRIAGVILILLVVTSAAIARRVVAPADDVGRTLSETVAGLIRPSDVSSITLQAPAAVAEVLVGVGDEIAAGQPIARLDRAEGQRDLRQLGLDVERARQDVVERERSVAWSRQAMERLQSGDPAAQLAMAERDVQQVPMRQAKDSPERAQAAFEQALLRVLRLEQLSAAGLVARQEVEEAQAAYRVAGDDLRNATRAAESAERLRAAEETNTRARRSQSLADQQRQLAEQQTALQQARLNLTQVQMRYEGVNAKAADEFIRAPRAGTILELPMHAGDRLTAGAIVARLASIDPMTIDIDVAPLVVNTLKVGDAARVAVSSMNLTGQTARVRSIGPLPAENGKYPVQLTLTNPKRARLAGQTAEVTLVVPERAPAR